MNCTDKAVIDDLRERIERDGFAIVRDFVPASLVHKLRELCATPLESSAVARRGDSVYGIRNLLTTVPGVRDVLLASPFQPLMTAVMGSTATPVMGVFFDKLTNANWPVPWHQDMTFRVREWRDIPGFEPRPVRDGMVHVLPPAELAERMLSIRIHLDDASASHGALRVIPGSHRQGRLSNEQVDQAVTANAVTCEVRTGDLMLMRPLILHASSACETPGHRRGKKGAATCRASPQNGRRRKLAAVDSPTCSGWSGVRSDVSDSRSCLGANLRRPASYVISSLNRVEPA